MIPNRKWSRDRKWSPKWTANDPRPQVISKVDRKWSRENLRNGMDFMGLIIKKNPFSLAFERKREGGRYISGQFIQGEKKNWINLKSMVLTVYFFLCRLLQFFLKNVSSFEKFKTGRTLHRKKSIILTPRSSPFLLRNYKAGDPLHNKSFIGFTDLFESVKLISQNI